MTNNNVIELKSCPPKRIQLPCQVCLVENKPTGLHYGIISCDACKVFYRRCAAMTKSDLPRCKETPVNRCKPGFKRFSCNACRFNKCATVGMCESAAKRGRYSLKMKHSVIKAYNHLKENSQSVDLLQELYPISKSPREPDGYSELTEMLRQEIKHTFAHYLFLYNPQYNERAAKAATRLQTATKEFLMQAVSFGESGKIVLISESGVKTSSFASMVTPLIMEQMSEVATPVTRMTKFIPGFKKIIHVQQLVLIKNAMPQLFLLLQAYTTDVEKRVLYRFYPQNDLLLAYTIPFFYSMMKMDPVHDLYMKLSRRIWNLKLNPGEIGLVIAIIVMNSDQPDISRMPEIEEIRLHLVTYLQHSFKINHSEDPQIFPKFMSLLPTFHEVAQNFVLPAMNAKPEISDFGVLEAEH